MESESPPKLLRAMQRFCQVFFEPARIFSVRSQPRLNASGFLHRKSLFAYCGIHYCEGRTCIHDKVRAAACMGPDWMWSVFVVALAYVLPHLPRQQFSFTIGCAFECSCKNFGRAICPFLSARGIAVSAPVNTAHCRVGFGPRH
jgi:hypothetical protein